MALNPTGLRFVVTAVAPEPTAFGANDWAISGPRADGCDIVVFAVPTGSAGATTAIHYQLNGGVWSSLGGAVAGVYPITGLTVETAYSIKLRAVNVGGTGTASAAKPLFTLPADPRGFRGWNPTVDLGTTGDVFIAPYGNDTTGTGAVDAPYLTLTKAVTVATSPDVIKARAGDYRELATMPSGVTLEGYGTEKPRFTASELAIGITQCDAGDATVIGSTLGVTNSPVYKFTVAKASLAYTHLQGLNPYEAGRKIFAATDRASNPNPIAFDQPSTFYTADSFTVNGSTQITAIVDADVITSGRYSEAQLLAATVLIHQADNRVNAAQITAVDFGTGTITVNGLLALGASGALKKYAIQNSHQGLVAGSFISVGSGSDVVVYIYPYDAANIGLIEYAARKRVIDLGAATGVTIRGIVADMASGGTPTAEETDGAINIYKTAGASVTSGHTLEHVFSGRNSTPIGYARAMRFNGVSDTVLRNCTLWECGGRGVFFSSGTGAVPGENNLVELSHFEWVGGSGFSCYTQNDMVFAHNYMNHNYGSHIDLSVAYIQTDGVVWWGNEFGPDCIGYFTWQEASTPVVAFNAVHIGAEALNDLRAIVDQTNATPPPVADSIGYIFNNSVWPEYGNSGTGVSINLTSSNSDIVYIENNNVAHGITSAAGTQVTPTSVQSNVITYLGYDGTSQTGASFDGTNAIQADLSLVYTDAAAGDFSPVSGSPILSTEGQDMASTIATLAARFTQFDGWTKDYKNQTIDWANLPVGADAGLTWVR